MCNHMGWVMAYGALNWQTLTLPFSGSLEQKTDVRLSSPPDLDLARDVQFEELGGVQTRPPFGDVMGGGAIFGGGTLSNCRRLAVVNGELCVFTDTTLYSWNAQLSCWVSRGTHLAVAVDETPRFVTTDDQVDGDRAELAGTVIYAWGVNSPKAIWVAALDKATGSMLMPPTALSGTLSRPRLVALATRILLFANDDANNSLKVLAIDPTSPATAVAGALTTVLATVANFYYDVVRAGTQDLVVGACRRNPTTSYQVFTVTPALSVTTSTKARTADGPLAVATIADGTQTQVIRGNGTSVQGDLLTTSSLADVFTAQAIGTAGTTPINQIAAAFSATTCTAFWSVAEQTGLNGAFELRKNTVTTSNAVGTQAVLVQALGIASRAFEHGGAIYVWTAFGSDSGVGSTSPAAVRAQLQNTYFLYRADGVVVSKAVWGVAGGFISSTGHLPGITASNPDSYEWLGAFRRRIEIGDNIDQSTLSARSLRDIAFSFDDNAARRTTVAGRTMYVAGGIVNQYDSRQLVEIGFLVYPWAFGATDNGAGNLSAGTYTWKATMRWVNAQGEIERSTTATGVQLTLAASHSADLQPAHLHVTNRLANVPNIEIWRQQVNAGDDAPYYLVTGQDPATTTGNNPYIPNNVTATSTHLIDNYADATLALKEANPENGNILESLAPPGAKIIVPTETRLILAGVAGDPDGVWYSRERGDGEIASFHDELRFDVPPTGGAITALWVDDQFVYVARETAIYAFAGTGLNNAGEGQNYTLVRTISRDVGVVSQEAHAPVPMGRLLKSSKGWYLLDIGGGLHYVGDAVSDFDSDTVVAVHTVIAKHQVRILTTSRLLLWDYRGLIATSKPDPGRWAEWTISDGLDAVMWQGQYVYLTAAGPKIEQTALTGLTYGLDVELSWVKLNELAGYGKLGEIQLLGELRSPCLVRMRVARDYQYDGAGNPVYFDDFAWSPTTTTVGSALQVSHKPSASNGWGEAFKIRITAVVEAARATLATASGLTPAVQTSGANWAATWKVADQVVGREYDVRPGEMGNAVTMSIAFKVGTVLTVDVRDHFAYNPSTGRWSEDLYNVGVLVTGPDTATVAQVEAGIAAGTKLAALQAGDVRAPTTAAAMTTACGGFGTWTAGYLCEDLSGLAAAFGGTNLTEVAVGGSPSYGISGPFGDKAVRISVQGSGFQAPNGTFLDIGTTDLCGVLVVRTLAIPSTDSYIVSKTDFLGGAGFTIRIQSNLALLFEARDTSSHNVITAPNAIAVNDWTAIMWGLDKATNKMRIGTQSLATGVQVISNELNVTGLGTLGNSSTVKVNRSGSLGAVLDIADIYMGVGVGAAAGMSANLSTALSSFCTAISGALKITTMAALAPAAGSFSGGAYGPPTGEAIKLTGLALEVGLQPGLKRLPAAQKA